MSHAEVPLRTSRERDLVAATRKLFDERGFRDAPVEEIAREVGIARGLIYRQFSSKEELFVLTVTDYLAELAAELDRRRPSEIGDPRLRLERLAEAFAGFCERYPGLSRQLAGADARAGPPAPRERLGIGLVPPRGRDGELHRPARRGACGAAPRPACSRSPTPTTWRTCSGRRRSARCTWRGSASASRQAAPGVPELFTVSPEEVVQSCVASAMATVGAGAT